MMSFNGDDMMELEKEIRRRIRLWKSFIKTLHEEGDPHGKMAEIIIEELEHLLKHLKQVKGGEE